MTDAGAPKDAAPVGPMIRAVTAGYAAAAGVLAAILALVNRADWWQGFAAAALASVLAAAVSLVPLAWGLRRGMGQMLGAYFLSAALRAIVSLTACVLAIVAGHYPAAPTLLLMVAFYFVLLTIEAAYLGRALWSAGQ